MIISNLLLRLTTIIFTFNFILISTSIETEKHPNTTSKVLKPLESTTVKISTTKTTTSTFSPTTSFPHLPTTSTHSKIGNKTITTKKYNLTTTIKISERSKTNTPTTTILIPTTKIVKLNLESTTISNLLNEKQKEYKNDKENNNEEEEEEEEEDDDWPAMPMFKSNLRKPVNLKSEELKGGNKKEENNYLNNSLNLRNNSIENISKIFNSIDENNNLTVTKLNNEQKSTEKIFNKLTTVTLQLTTKISRLDEATTTGMNGRDLLNISTSITETSKHKTSGTPKISNQSTTSASPSNKELTNGPSFTTASTHKVTTLSSTKLNDNLNNLSSVYPSEPLQNSPNYPSTTLYKRTTRSTRSSQNYTTITPSGSKGNWRSSISPFPWYFVAIGGFLFASIIFIFVFMTVRGFRQIFTKRTTQNSASTIEKSNTSESMIPMINHKKRKTNKIIKSKLIKTEGATKNETKSPKTKNKNESVNSECTLMNEEDSERLELKEGKQITVIDPLLNQQWSGIMSE